MIVADPHYVRQALLDGAELALVDVREEMHYGRGHIVPAVSVPLSRLELMLPKLVPGLNTKVVFYDDGEGLCRRALSVADAMGYASLFELEGGLTTWKGQGFPVYSGTHVTGAALAESIDRHCRVPKLTAGDLARMQADGDSVTVLDSRPWMDYLDNHIPGGVSCPLGELAYRVRDLVPDETSPVVVNCAGRTRSILGAQSLIEAELPNPVYSLVEGTYGWGKSGRELDSGTGPRADSKPVDDITRVQDRARQMAGDAGIGGRDDSLVLLSKRHFAPSKARRILQGGSPCRVRVSYPPVSSLASGPAP